MVSIQASVSKGWLNKYGAFEFNESYYLDPLFRLNQDKLICAFVKEKFPDYPVYNMEDNLMQAEYMNNYQIIVGGLQPNLILGNILGSGFTFPPDKDSDIKDKPLENVSSANELPELSSLLDSPIIKKITEQISDIKKGHPELSVIPPFFWDSSGRATIHGIITTSLKLIGENIFILMMSDPGFVHAVHKWITEAYIILIDYFAKLAPLKTESIHIGECSCAMLSPKHFEEFVVPYLNILGKEYKNIRLHSCGNSDTLINSFGLITGLSSIDVGGGTSIKLIREKFGNKIDISAFSSPDLLVKGAEKEKIHSWIDELLKDNKDGNLRISYHIEPGYDLENCLEINRYLEEKYIIKQKRLF